MSNLVTDTYYEWLKAGYTSKKVNSIIHEREMGFAPRVHIESAVEPDAINILSIEELRKISLMMAERENALLAQNEMEMMELCEL